MQQNSEYNKNNQRPSTQEVISETLKNCVVQALHLCSENPLYADTKLSILCSTQFPCFSFSLSCWSLRVQMHTHLQTDQSAASPMETCCVLSPQQGASLSLNVLGMRNQGREKGEAQGRQGRGGAEAALTHRIERAVPWLH